jgi:hypothetical protein
MSETTHAFVQAIWAREPEDIRRLKATNLPPGGRWSGVFFCNLIMLWSAQVLGLQRALVLEGSLPVETACSLITAELTQLADWLAHWHMDDTCALLRRVSDELATQPPRSPRNLAETIEQLLIAINRMQNWTDAFVPWAQLDRLLPGLEK